MLKLYDVFLDIVESGLLCFPKTQVATKTEPYYLLSFEEKRIEKYRTSKQSPLLTARVV